MQSTKLKEKLPEGASDKFGSTARQLRLRYIFALSLIALLTLSSQWVIQRTFAAQDHDSRIINIAGRQRMLGQKITKACLYLINTESPERRTQIRGELNEALSLWERSHKGLQYGDVELGLPGSNSAEVTALFQAIESNHQAMIAAAREVLAASDDPAILRREIGHITENEAAFARGMDAIVFRYDDEAKARVGFSKRIEIWLAVATLLTLMLEARFIFAPAVNRLQRNIVERMRTDARLQLAASVFAHAREGITITDALGNIVEVNDTFTRITGYSREEVLGQNPRILKSGRHGPEYYSAMWRALQEDGYWAGEIWNRRKNGEVYAELLTISALSDADGKLQNYIALFPDITPMKEHQQQLEHIAHYDALTNLPNRVLLADRLRQGITQSQRQSRSLAVVFLDLDGFKEVNDKHGHDAGDELLIAVSRRMKAALREGDTLTRIGGDEFVAVLTDLVQPEDCEAVLTRLLQAAAEPEKVAGQLLNVTVSIGVALYPRDGANSDLLLHHADQAMYLAKQAGKNRYHLFDANHHLVPPL